MDNNQTERKSINLSKEQSQDRPIREAYPVYKNNMDADNLQRQEYRNLQQPQQREYKPIYRDNADNDTLQRQEYRNLSQQRSYQNTATQYQEPVNYNIPNVQPINANDPPANYKRSNLDHYYDYNDPQQEQSSSYQQPGNGYQQNNYQQSNTDYANRNVFMPQQESMKYCKYCGQRIPSDAVVCTHCGRQVEILNGAAAASNHININTQPQRIYPQETFDAFNTSDKSKSTSLVLAALGFLGLGGLHRFYTGKIISGFVYLFTGGLYGLGTFIDILKIASNTFTDGTGRVIRK